MRLLNQRRGNGVRGLLSFGVGLVVGGFLISGGIALADINCGGGVCYGNSQPNTMHGTSSRDVMYGYSGDDTMYGNGADDDLYGNDDRDGMEGGPGFDGLAGGPGTDTIYGNGGDDNLYGYDGDDNLYGYDDGDYLDTEQGHEEYASGGLNNDTINTYRNNAGGDAAHGESGTDACYTDPADARFNCEGGGDL